ncbi:hypothetical protein BASA50_004134 [Batrachochytrium salamandrivorans]|uniref:Uncharacterized protein n=1 Tax=Batrachochytrium salamandrivorans TaxID=1357716 RepID=A0ABQ8FGM3_9FUNG|nr:hypothetical protein BASA60_007743 [Batrachochytrium salamandrivorans]KAH6575896.1 hypothetical protein BASA62_001703 [Batrachochytrium salamandrivorans]KAH6597624.1 hypothetical protein BASA61_003077 [Batrachochytrium salamandrivorans]KAH6597980.1 hypothetical protein BASA50_004134 [Batrachochytrium salamandrivorans]KAH9269989.1 hypothetical protein BASA83_007977 [Batrachochytrium salamandrivorans]
MTGHPTIVVESALPNLPPHGRTSGQTLDRGIYGHLSPTSGEPLPPRASTDLQRGETIMRSTSSVVKNTQKYGYSDLVRMDASVVPKIALPALALTLWSVFWTIAYISLNWKGVGVQNQLIGIISVVMGLLLVFRTNTAYDRFWEARRLWGILFSHTRNLTRFIWVHCPVTEEHDVYNKYAVTNLILAYAVSVKHHLREESGHKFEDLHNLLIHLPDYRPGTFHPPVGNLPLEISRHISAYTVSCRKRDQADIPTFTAMTVAISGMVDCLSNFERIRNCPIPLAYSIHLKQTLFVYLLALPFQLVIGMGWATIPIVAVASFTLLGIEAIGGEIENPFGYDPNDLRVDQFCDEIRRELAYVMEHPTKADPSQWDRPVSLTDPMYGTFVQLNYKRNAAHKSS